MDMLKTISRCTRRSWVAAVLLCTLAAGCGGGRDPILGIGGVGALAPLVTAVTPVNGATGVATFNTVVTATFNEPMSPLTGGASFTLTCDAADCDNPTGTVTLDASNTIATFTLTPSTALRPLTFYNATITAATGLVSGLALATPYTWRFQTATAPAAPRVIAVVPANLAIDVPLNDSISATFSEAMAPITGAASFTVTCLTPCVNPTGTVALDASHKVATFTLTAGTLLTAGEPYTATITGATSLATGVALATPYQWNFTTGITTNTTRPRVLLTSPVTTTPGPTPGVPTNSALTAAFSEDMAPATLNASTFTVTCLTPCVAPVGAVTYDASSNTAVFTPSAPLAAGVTYKATITTGATDLAGNALAGNQAPPPAASDYVWTFTTVAAGPPSHITVASTNPIGGATGVCPNASVNATFTLPSGLRMDPSTITTTTFTLTGPAPAVTSVPAASVSLDAATGTIATFTPQVTLIPTGTYTATLMGGATGVKDLAVPADDMVSNHVWTFTVGPATGNCLAPPPLGAASTFGNFGGTAGMTNTGTLTVINGDIGTIAVGTSSITGFHDTAGDIYTETPANKGAVNGTIYTCTNSTTGPTAAGPNAANCAVASQALLAAQKAYADLAAMPGNIAPSANLGGLVLTPGVYTAPAGSFMIVGSDLTLDAQGNANAVFVFQMATSLTVGTPSASQSITLVGGALPKNVFWQVGSAATINAAGGGTMVGTIIAQTGLVFSTVGNVDVLTLNGRALSLGASVTMVDTVINVPRP